MAIQKINIENFLELAIEHPVLDVRSPGEYGHAHIPGAHTLPLFTDEERKIVGTAYKQESREKAIKLGLDFFGPKMQRMIEEAERICGCKLQIADSQRSDKSEISNLKSKILLVYCWRGGMRSAGVAWLLDLYGFKVYTLIGGYKNFRQYVLNIFKLPFQFNVVGGYTGSGKTEVLRGLQEQGARVVDLENIARHKGSAFGNIGMPKQPGQEMFENLLAMDLRRSVADDPLATVWLEDESQRIGLVNIPNDIWNTMRQSPVYFLNIPFEERLKHIIDEYGSFDKQRMIDAIGRIREKLGGLNAKNAIAFLDEENIPESFRILLEYYDRFYLKALHNRKGLNSLLHTIQCKSVTPENAQLLVSQQQYQPQNP
jgi:tRNA 2-selenouridine synthase